MSEEKETSRIEAFSDGVFSIAITLLVLEIKVPKVSEITSSHSLAKALVEMWPAYLAYFMSFFTVLVMWVNHHRVFNLIRRVDNTFLFINGFLLMIVALTPFPTHLLAEYIQNPQHASIATAVFMGTYILIAVGFNALWFYASRNKRLLGKTVTHTSIHEISTRYLYGPIGYGACFIFSFIDVRFSLAIFMTLTFFFCFTGTPLRCLRKDDH